jgi:sirohydrochlorin ferrochelatase
VKNLILVAHGSRREASNEEIRQLTAALAEKAGSEFDRVSCAFLELAEPTIPDGIEQAVEAGAQEVVVLPYFLSAGRHVAEDIPELVKMKCGQHPHVEIRVAPYLGASGGVADLLLAIAIAPRSRPGTP